MVEACIFDYRLGYVRADCEASGFDVLGGDDAPGGRIVTLGGYTTPEQAKNHTSWADSLYEQFGGKYQILNGCTNGYTSAQEMTMLIRDVILLKPKLVICLSGFYNFAYKLGFLKDRHFAEILKTHPFTTPGQIEFYNKITARFGLGNDKIYYGEENHLPAWEYWLSHVDITHCLCKEFGIRHMTFLQPCIFSGNYTRSRSEDDALIEAYDMTTDELNQFAAEFRKQYAQVAMHTVECRYVADLSSLFDGIQNVYLDACHVKPDYLWKMISKVAAYIDKEMGTP